MCKNVTPFKDSFYFIPSFVQVFFQLLDLLAVFYAMPGRPVPPVARHPTLLCVGLPQRSFGLDVHCGFLPLPTILQQLGFASDLAYINLHGCIGTCGPQPCSS